MAKNKWIGAILSFFIPGLGQAYLGLYKRFVVFLAVTVLINILYVFIFQVGTIALLLMFISMAWSLYAIYDAYLCTHAVNTTLPIPPLFGQDIQ